MPRRVLHLVERSRRGRYCAGQWKDFESFNQNLRLLNVEFECIEFDYSELDQLVEKCREANARDIILYYSFLPEVLFELRKKLPAARLYVRTVNAEALQHWQRADVTLRLTYQNLRSIYGAVRLAWRDSQCKRFADALLGISHWDNEAYWKRLPGRARIYDVPYVCPWPALRPHVTPLPWVERRNEIVCLAGGRDPIGRTMVAGFDALADRLGKGGALNDWVFSLSPGILQSDKEDKLSGCVQRLQSLDEPWDLLCSVRALAVLTPLGFGFKTTIVDALVAGCHVLVHPTLAKRLPGNIRSHCIEFSAGDNIDTFAIGQRLKQEPRGLLINEGLRGQATRELQRAFCTQ